MNDPLRSLWNFHSRGKSSHPFNRAWIFRPVLPFREVLDRQVGAFVWIASGQDQDSRLFVVVHRLRCRESDPYRLYARRGDSIILRDPCNFVARIIADRENDLRILDRAPHAEIEVPLLEEGNLFRVMPFVVFVARIRHACGEINRARTHE